MTRIVVTRSGGFAGITRTAEVSEPDAVARILHAVRERSGAELPARPDAFVFDFAVQSESATTESYTLPESMLPQEICALLP